MSLRFHLLDYQLFQDTRQKICWPNVRLWFTASAIGGVLAGLLGGEATGEGLESMTPIFSFMIKYYLVIGVILALLSFVIKPAEKESAN